MCIASDVFVLLIPFEILCVCSQRMSQRLSGYHLVASNARLRQQLAAKGGYLPSGDFISSRMAELKGSPTHSPCRLVYRSSSGSGMLCGNEPEKAIMC